MSKIGYSRVNAVKQSTVHPFSPTSTQQRQEHSLVWFRSLSGPIEESRIYNIREYAKVNEH